MSPAGALRGTTRLLDGLLTVVLRALGWTLGLVGAGFVLWFASNVIAPIPAVAATREVQLASVATPHVAAGPPNPHPTGLAAGEEAGGTDSGSTDTGSTDTGSTDT
ncbi:hypothetical protein, partial [Actinomycetospora aeridis]